MELPLQSLEEQKIPARRELPSDLRRATDLPAHIDASNITAFVIKKTPP